MFAQAFINIFIQNIHRHIKIYTLYIGNISLSSFPNHQLSAADVLNMPHSDLNKSAFVLNLSLYPLL